MTDSEKYFLGKGYKIKGQKTCECCGQVFNIFLKRDFERKRFCSRVCFGKINSKEKKLIPPRPTEEAHKKAGKTIKRRMQNGEIPLPPKNNRKGIPLLKIRGENHPKWIKDRNKLKLSRFDSSERRGQISSWRADVYTRDDFTCQKCLKRGGKLNAHHIKSWAKYPEHRFDLENGITLCEVCHKSIHKKEKETKCL